MVHVHVIFKINNTITYGQRGIIKAIHFQNLALDVSYRETIAYHADQGR